MNLKEFMAKPYTPKDTVTLNASELHEMILRYEDLKLRNQRLNTEYNRVKANLDMVLDNQQTDNYVELGELLNTTA